MKPFWQELADLVRGRNPSVVGAISGLLLALSLVIFGFFKTLFIIGLTVLGSFLAVRYFANRESFRNLLDKILPPGKFR